MKWKNEYVGVILVALTAGACGGAGETDYDDAGIDSNSSAVTSASTPRVQIPALIQAEAFSAASDSSSGNTGNIDCTSPVNLDVDIQTTQDPQGGECHIGWTTAGEWLDYKIKVPSAGNYQIALRLAAASAGKKVSILLGNNILGEVEAPTLGWQSFQTKSITANLAAGNHRLRVRFEQGAVNFNFIDIKNASGPASSCSDGIQNGSESGVDCGGSCQACVVGDGTLVRTPVVAEAARYPKGIKSSTRYRVLAKRASDSSAWNASRHSTATYEAYPEYPDMATVPNEYKDNHVHFSQVDSDEPVRFRVELLSGSIQSLKLKPARYDEIHSTEKDGSNWVEFTVNPADLTKHILVEINESASSSHLEDGLMVFVNPPSERPSGRVLELPSGVVDSSYAGMDNNSAIIIPSNSPYDGMYIPSDTIVKGRIEVKKNGFKIMGRGMVVGSQWTWPKSDPNWGTRYPITADGSRVKGIVTNGGGDSLIEGIMTVHPYHFNFVGGRTSRNLKAFAWRHSSDGIHGVDTAEGCFTRVNDDHIYAADRDIHDNSYWGMSNGSIFQQGWGNAGSNYSQRGGGRVSRANILRMEYTGDGGERQNNGVFGSVEWGTGNASDISFEDVMVEGPTCRFINFDMASNKGTWSNFVFRDVWFEKLGCPDGAGLAGSPLNNYLVIGGSLRQFTFDNVFIGAKKVMSLADLGPSKKQNVQESTFVYR